MPWYAIRTIYHFGVRDDGLNVYEERVVSFEAPDWPAAHAKAKAESRKYATDQGFSVHSTQVGYEQDGAPLIDGYELWSELYESDLSLNDFFVERYAKYDYHPD